MNVILKHSTDELWGMSPNMFSQLPFELNVTYIFLNDQFWVLGYLFTYSLLHKIQLIAYDVIYGYIYIYI